MQLRYQMKHGHRDAHPRWCEVSKNPGFWLKLWPDSHQDFLPKLKLVWRFHIFLTFDQTHWKPESSAPFPNIFPTGKAMAFPFHRTHWRFSWDGLETRSRLSPASLGKDTQRPCDRWPRQSEFFLVSEREFDHNFLVRPCQTILNCWNILVNLYKSNPRFPC